MNRSCKQIVIGLPSTGKTTYLAALWHVVESQELASSLTLARLGTDRVHLNNLRSEWLECNEMPRTSIAAERTVSMLLSDPLDTTTSAEVWFPDMSGESFILQCQNRTWSKDYDTWVRDAAGALVFLHPLRVIEPVRIDMANELIETIDQAELKATHSNVEYAEFRPWSQKNTPTQVLMVELLQLLASRPYLRIPFRLAIIVSAWDLVLMHEPDVTPEDWLAKRLPLLSQFIRANDMVFDQRVYGVSAQGGKLDTDSARLLQINKASERIKVMHDGVSSHDITLPVRWIMS